MCWPEGKRAKLSEETLKLAEMWDNEIIVKLDRGQGSGQMAHRAGGGSSPIPDPGMSMANLEPPGPRQGNDLRGPHFLGKSGVTAGHAPSDTVNSQSHLKTRQSKCGAMGSPGILGHGTMGALWKKSQLIRSLGRWVERAGDTVTCVSPVTWGKES